MALMVLVNNGGGPASYKPLEHSAWNGWTITDVVFPSFLWIVGVAITLSLTKRKEAGVSSQHLLAQVFRRSCLIFALGLLVYAFPHFHLAHQRILGVLQRIAICYFIASAIYLYSGIRAQLIWIVSLLAGYWLLMMLVPVPGYGAGHLDVAGNFAHYIDSIVLGRHNYGETKTWDPEGIVSTIPAIATALFGVMAGHLLRLKKELSERTTWLFLLGNILLALGLICDVWLPINKKLWTSSFSLFMAGLDFVLLAGFLWLIDGRGHKRFVQPLVILGMNAIAIYLASEFLAEFLDAVHWHMPIYKVFASFASPLNASLLYAVSFVLVMFGLAYFLFRRRWFLRV